MDFFVYMDMGNSVDLQEGKGEVDNCRYPKHIPDNGIVILRVSH
jgi:hypothetical protein